MVPSQGPKRFDLDALQRCVATLGTSRDVVSCQVKQPLRDALVLCRFGGCRHRQQLAAAREVFPLVPVGEQTEVADPHVAMRQHVQEKTPDELVSFDGHRLAYVAAGAIPVAEADLAMVHGKESVVRDRHPVGVPTKVVEDLLGPGKRLFAVKDPPFAPQGVA